MLYLVAMTANYIQNPERRRSTQNRARIRTKVVWDSWELKGDLKKSNIGSILETNVKEVTIANS